MEQNHLEKEFFLDFSNHQELCCSQTEKGRVVISSCVGDSLSVLLNMIQELERARIRIAKLFPDVAVDGDAYMVLLSVNIGNTSLSDSPFAAKLFALLDYIASLHPLLYISMQMERLLIQLERNAPEKAIIQNMAFVTARAAQSLDALLRELPEYRRRVDVILNHTILENGGHDKMPVLTRAWIYQKKSGKQLPGFDAMPPRLLMAMERNGVVVADENYAPTKEPQLFYGESLQGKNPIQILAMLFRQMLLEDSVVRVCGVCGRYFIPQVRSNEKYCTHTEVINGTPLTCKQRSTKNRLKNDPSLRLLKAAYDKNFIKANRKKDPSYVDNIFRPWYAWAKEQRALYLEEKLTVEELTERLSRHMEQYIPEI